MLKRSRLYFSAMLTALVLASLLITSNVKACEEEPQTFLSLYMNSDLIVLAKYKNDGETKKANEDEYGYSTETPRNLEIVKVYKGQKDLQTVSFIYSDYVSKTVSEEPSEVEPEVYEDHFNVSKIKMGGEYLFFLSKDKESGAYGVTDYVSGVRENDKNFSVYEKNLGELFDIAANKKNQMSKLAEWLVKNIEDPIMREDSINDLSESFSRLKYPEEGISDKAGPFVNLDGYGVYTVGVAAKLTPAQVNRVSAVLYPMLQEAWFAEPPEYANYGIASILGGINKTKLAVHAYNSLQSVAKDDTERKFIIMDFLTAVVEDETLSDTYYKYSELEGKIKESPTDTPAAKKEMKAMLASKNVLLANFDKRFKLLYSRNFASVENKK